MKIITDFDPLCAPMTSYIDPLEAPKNKLRKAIQEIFDSDWKTHTEQYSKA